MLSEQEKEEIQLKEFFKVVRIYYLCKNQFFSGGKKVMYIRLEHCQKYINYKIHNDLIKEIKVVCNLLMFLP